MAESTASRKEGCLYKLGGNGRKWMKRYFVINGDKVDYFKDERSTKIRGSISLAEAKGVRGKSQCRCKWPGWVTDEYSFGLATFARTYYFYTTIDDGNVRDWKVRLQALVEKHGSPDTNWQDDHDGKPESSKSFIARKTGALAAKTTKMVVNKVPGVDPKVAAAVGGVADVVEQQAEMDPNASPEERVLKGATTGGKGALNVAKHL